MMRKITRRKGKREWKYMQKTNRNIKLLSPTKSLCSVVLHILRERRREAGTKIEPRFQVLLKECMNH